MPQIPSGGGCMTPPIAPCPSAMMSTNAWRSIVSDIARRNSGLSNGGTSRLTSRLRATFGIVHVADRLRHLVLDVLQLRHRHAEIDVLLAGHERQQPGRDVLDDPVFDAVEIGPPRFPVIRVAGHRDRLVRLELDEFERPGADRMLPHLRRRYVARIDRRPAGRQHRQQRRLRPLQVKGDLVVAVGRHLRHIVEPGFARVDAQLFLRLALQQVDRAFDVGGGERLAVMPFDALVQREGQFGAVLAPAPARWRAPGRSNSGVFCGSSCLNMTRLLNTPIIGRFTASVDSSSIDMLAGLSKWPILSVPPDFCANAGSGGAKRQLQACPPMRARADLASFPPPLFQSAGSMSRRPHFCRPVFGGLLRKTAARGGYHQSRESA